jgi:hypothetical protein
MIALDGVIQSSKVVILYGTEFGSSRVDPGFKEPA